MRDYEELVKRLRSVKDIWQSEEEQWMLDAADAIEELQKALDVVNDAHNEGYDVGYWAGRRDYEPKWISVEERLPEKGVVVLAFGTRSATTGQFQGVGTAPWFWWWKGHTIKRVTHWMPLPEPPSGES